MTPLHLSDAEIQQAADHSHSLSPASALHLRGCAVCQAQVSGYQQLFTGLAAQPKPAFAFDLAALVVAQLPPLVAKSTFPWALALVAALVLGLVGGALLVLGPDLALLFSGLSSVLGGGLLAVVGCWVIGQGLEMLAQHRRQMSRLLLS